MLVTILSYGVLLRPDLAPLRNPSMAGVLQAVVGPWGAVFVSIGLLFRSLGHIYRGCSSLRKSSIRLELRHHAALSFPRKQERRSFDGPVAYQVVQIFLVLTLFAEYAFHLALELTSSMILVPYILVAAPPGPDR